MLFMVSFQDDIAIESPYTALTANESMN